MPTQPTAPYSARIPRDRKFDEPGKQPHSGSCPLRRGINDTTRVLRVDLADDRLTGSPQV